MGHEREDDFLQRRKHLENLSEEELENLFWKLCNDILDPVMDLAKTHTTPSIERSVLLRMGFSSLESKELVDLVMHHGLMGKGAGHVVYKVSQEKQLPIREAGLKLIQDDDIWLDVKSYFEEGDQ